MEVDTDDPRSADTMEEIIPTHVDVVEEAERIDSFSTSLDTSPLEERQISPHHSRPLPRDEEGRALFFSEPSHKEPDSVLKSFTQNTEIPTTSAIDPHCQEPRKPDKGKANAVDRDWAGWGNDGWGTPTAVVVANQDTAPMNPNGNGKGEARCDNWDSGWSTNNGARSAASHATISPPTISSSAVPATTTMETTNAASVNSLQEAPQPNQSTTEKSANNSWGSWGANNRWGSPAPAGGAASGWSGNESRGPPAPRLSTTGENAVTTMTAASTSAWGGTSGWNPKATGRGNFEGKSEGSFERGRGRGRGGGRGRDRDWSGFGGSGRRFDFSSGDQPLAKSFNQSSTSFGNPESGWGTRPKESNGTIETRRYRKEQSSQPAWGLSTHLPPIHQAQPPMESQVYQYPLSLASPVTMRSALWPLHTDLKLKRDFSQHTSKIAKYQARLTELETKQRHVHSWYNSQTNNLPQLHTDDPEALEQELNKARLRRDDNLAALEVDEKKYAGLAEFEWMLLVRTLTEEMVRTLESGVHELLWKMTAAAGDGKRGFDINSALEEIVKTAMPRIIERPLQRYAESIVKATEKESRKVEAAALSENHPMKEQSDTKQVSSSDLQEILGRLSALEQENTDLKASNVQLQEAIQQLEVKTQEKVSSVRKEALGWTLDGNDHPVARQIREKFLAERDFIIEGITSNLQLAFEAVLDRHSPDV